MDGTPKYSKVNQNVLADFALTMQESPNLTEKEILSKFPEFDNDVNAIHSALDYVATVQGGIPKDIGTKFPEFDFGGTNPAEKKNPATELPSADGSSGLLSINYGGEKYDVNPKTQEVFKGGKPVNLSPQAKDYIAKNILGNVATAQQDGEQPKPYTLGQVATERKKKVELNKGLKGAAQSYKDYEDANKNLRNAQMDLTAGLQGEKDVIQTDVLGKPVAIQGSLTKEKIKGLQENVDLAKSKKQAAKDSLIKVAPAFKDRNIDIVSELQKDNTDVEETVIPQAVEKIKFVENISDLEDTLKANGQTLDDWSKYVDNEAPKEFLDDKQRALYDVVKTGDEAKIKAAQEAYFKDIDDEIRGIDSQITQISVSGMPIAGTGVSGQQQIADLKKQKEDLLNKKQGFLQPADALKQVAEIDPSFGVFDQLFAKISPMQRVKMTLDNLYAKRVKQKAELNAMTNDPQIVLTQALPFQNKISDLNADIIKTDQAIRLLAPIAFLNQKPDMEQSNWTRFGRGVWNTMLEENSGISFPKKEDIADKTTSLMAASQTLDNISIAGKKALKATAPTLTDKAIDMASYMTAIGVTYAPIGGIVKATRLPAMARMAFSNIGKYSPLLGMVAPSLATMTTEGVTSELTGRALGGNAKQDLTFLSKFGAQGVTELLNNSPFGKLVSKAISGIGIKEVPKFVQTLAKINSTGTGSLIEEGVEEGISMYQNSDSYEDFKKQIKQFVSSPSDLFLFAASSYALGGFTSGISPNVSNKFYQAADKAYSDLPPDEKAAFDNVVNDVKQGQEDAVMEVVLKTVDKVPNKVVDGLVTDLTTAADVLGKTEVGEDGYTVKVGDTVYQGNTPQDLQNDIDDVQSLLAIYKGEQDNRTQNGITIEETEETPPTAESDQTNVVLAKPEAGVGVGEEPSPINTANAPETVQNAQENGQNVVTETATEKLPQGGEVKETITEKQVPETTKKIYTDTNEVGTTQYYTVNDNGNIESSIEVSPVGSDIVIDNAKVSPTEKRKGLASSLVDKIIQDYKGKTNTYIDENGNEITEPYQIKLGTVVSNEGTGFAKSIQKKIDDFNAEQKQINKAPTGEVKAEPSVKAEAEKEAAPPTEQELDDYYEALEQEKKNVNRGVQKDLGLKGGDTIPYKNAVIHAKIGSAVSPNDLGGTISKESFEEFGDPNHLIGNDKATKYLRKLLGVDEPLSKGTNRKVTQKLDTLAAEISESNNIEVTPEDIVEYLLDRAKRPEAYRKAPNKKTTVAAAVADTNNKAADDIETLGRLGTFADDFNIDDPAIQGELAFLFDEGDLKNLKEYINHLNLPENAEQKRKVQKRLQGIRDVNNAIRGGEQVESPTGIKETTPTPTEAEVKKKEFTAKVDDLAAKLKAKIGTDPNIQKMGLDANDVVDFIASVVKEAGKAAIDVAEAIKTAKAKLKELGVDEDLINEAEAKYTGKETKEQAIPTETIDNLLKANTRSKAINNIADANIKEVATIVSDTNGRFKKVMDILNGDTQALTDLEEKLGFKKIC